MMQLAQRVREIQESVTMAFDKKAKDMKAKHPETIILAAGEPDFAPPQAVIEATAEAAKTGKTKYTPVKGIVVLLQAIANYIKATRNLVYDALTQVITTNGGKEGIYLALMSIVNPGDYVIIVAPYWTSYPEMIKLAGGIPLIVDYKDLANLEAILQANPGVKAIILNSPSNPSGTVIAPEVLAAMAKLLADKDIWVVSDEIYSPIVYGENKHVSIAQFPGMQEKTVIIDGASKAFAMTGYRLGYALGPKEVIAAMAKFKSQISSCVSSISQYAALAALGKSAEDVKKMKAAYEQRLNNIILPFVEETGLEVMPPQGAFYLFFKIPGDKVDCLKFCEDLLEQEKLGLVPGMAFGYPGWVRISFAASDQELTEGLARLKRFLNK
ncbi:MAG: pyridoxal phosphate-dependent aminotransferase [Candidatus Parcubacteria bacterium]|nr:pyridoxal phosphate-dependent aminotransferase [Candidatus Parcubacteria bacterium]